MTDDQCELLVEARDSIAAARTLLERGFAGYAASRAYYAMFYIAEAFLEGEGMAFSKHSAVIAAFGREFTRVGRVPAEFHGYLLEARDARHVGDYGIGVSVEKEEAAKHIERAERFLAVAEELIGPVPPEDEDG